MGWKRYLHWFPLTDAIPDIAAPTRADPDTERYALFDAVVALLEIASTSAPVVLILDDLHWAAKPTLLLLRHLLRFGEHARVQIVGTYRSTDLDRSHPLAAMLADLHRDGTANRISLSGLDEDDVSAYVAEAGYDDEELARALASVTGGNPFFLIEALRHVDESGGRWDPSTLPQGVREAVSRRLSRLPMDTNKALAAAAVVGSRFALDLVERVVDQNLVDAFDEACKAGIIIEEPGGRYRFNHAIVRQSLLAELASVRRMRLHQRIAATLETQPGADDELLAELAYHYFECAWAGNAAKAVEYCRRAADQAMARLGYEGAADLYDHALHALEELDDELPDRDDQAAELLVARCEALLAAGDVASAASAVSQLQAATVDSARLAAWATCFDGQLSMLIHPERLDEVEAAVGAAAHKLAEIDDAAGEAKAHTVRAGCLARLGRIGDCEITLDDALTAARRAREHRRVNAVLAGAPLAALWGPNPVPRAGGRCLDVVRLLRIKTDSPAVEATSTRCQAVLEAFRGRAAAARRMIDSARRTVTELGLRHALLEVEQFAGIVELVVDDPAAAEPHLRKAYNGFRRMGLDADTAEAAALLGRTCLALDRDAEADELSSESQRLAGHALKASIAWRMLRAQLLSRRSDHDGAKRVAEAAVALAERTDLLVDHGDACLALATVLDAAGDTAVARAAAERAVDLYERKSAAALVEKARRVLGERDLPTAPAPPEAPTVELDNACARAIERVVAAIDRGTWDEFRRLFAPEAFVVSRRKIVGFAPIDVQSRKWPHEMRRYLEIGVVRLIHAVVAVRGERLALARLVIGTADMSPGAPHDEFLQLSGIDDEGRIAWAVWLDLEDIDAAIAELDAAHARFAEEHPRAPLDNAASRAVDRINLLFVERRWDEIGAQLASDVLLDDRRRGLRQESTGRAVAVAQIRAVADVGAKHMTSNVRAIRGERLALVSNLHSGQDQRPQAFHTELLRIIEVDADGLIVAAIAFDPDDFDAAIAELDARYIVGEAAPHARVWQMTMDTLGELNRHQPGPMIRRPAYADHRRVPFGSGEDFGRAVEELWALVPDARYRITEVHALDAHGAVASLVIEGTDAHGNELQWARIVSFIAEEPRVEVYEEDDVDAAVARFEELHSQARRLENAASRVYERLKACFAARDWDAIAEILADDISTEDRRRVVNAGLRQGRDAAIAEISAYAELGTRTIALDIIATRGDRLVLSRGRPLGRDRGPEAFSSDVFDVVETDAEGRVAARVVFDPEDIDAAFAELDARYLVGEAAPYAHTWSVIMGGHAAVNRHELPPITPDCVSVDHRRGTAFAPGELIAYFRAGWDLNQDIRTYVEVVHRLTDLGAVYTHVGQGVSRDGFDAEWRGVDLLTVEGDMVNRCKVFDEADLDTAVAWFEQLSRPAPRLENTASRVAERFLQRFAARDWDAIAEILTDDFSSEDRRPVVGAGIRYGRDVEIASIRAGADLGGTNWTSTVIATRGERLILTHTRYSGQDEAPDAFRVDVLGVVEIGANNRIAARVVLEADDLDAAFEELDARYVAGEAAAQSRTWSVIAGTYAAMNRRELPPTTPDWVNIDHRRGTAFAPGDAIASLRATWDLAPDFAIHIETVHRLSDLGSAFTFAAHGTSRDGLDAEWREVAVVSVEGDLINHCEIFELADLDAALARFDELSRPTRRLENAASQVDQRFWTYFAARDWAAMGEILADDISADDRRRVVNAGIRLGRDAKIADMRATADLGTKNGTSTVIAIRGQRLALVRIRLSGRDQRPDAFHTEMLGIVEINADNRMAARVLFNVDDIDAAFEELDARYLAGEVADRSHTWSVIARECAAFNRHELPAADWVTIDHRSLVTIDASDLHSNIRATWDLMPDMTIHIETVHRLSSSGAVVTYTAYGTTPEGFDAEWRMIQLLTVEGDEINRCELFDVADLDAALARFEELHQTAPRLQNAASRLYDRFNAYLAARDWDAMAEMVADDVCDDDRRRVVSGGIRRGRDAAAANWRAVVDVGGKNIESVVIATRGERLALTRTHVSGGDQRPDTFGIELLNIVEIDTDNRIAAGIQFDPDGIDAAFEELDARYIAGEAAAHARTWSVIARDGFAALNQHELPAATPDWVNVDHRRGTAHEPGDLPAYLRAAWGLAPDRRHYIEAVHQLSDLGAVCTAVAYGASQEGFDAEWRMVALMTVEGELLSRCEIFDEAALDAALVRFEELGRPPPLENAATRMWARISDAFNCRDLDGVLALVAADGRYEDRRKVLRDEGPARPEVVRALFEATRDWWSESETLAVRGSRLALTRDKWRDTVDAKRPITIEHFTLIEVTDDNLVRNVVLFDPDDINGAIGELTARWIASGQVAHPEVIEAARKHIEAVNRHDWEGLLTANADATYVSHRQLAAGATDTIADHMSSIQTLSTLVPDLWLEPAEILTHSASGCVTRFVLKGTSTEGLAIELPIVTLMLVDGDRVTRFETFDLDQRDLALARFDELSRTPDAAPWPRRLVDRTLQLRSEVVPAMSACAKSRGPR